MVPIYCVSLNESEWEPMFSRPDVLRIKNESFLWVRSFQWNGSSVHKTKWFISILDWSNPVSVNYFCIENGDQDMFQNITFWASSKKESQMGLGE